MTSERPRPGPGLRKIVSLLASVLCTDGAANVEATELFWPHSWFILKPRKLSSLV